MKSETQSFLSKLWLYFILFAAVILSLLWILQTVFLQRFYDNMMERKIRSAAEQITAASRTDSLTDIIDQLSAEDSLLVYITDDDGDILYSSDSYKSYFRKTGKGESGKNSGLRKIPEQQISGGVYRTLPDDFDKFLSRLKKSENGTVSYTVDNTFICGSLIELKGEDDAVLFVSGTLDVVGGAASIIRQQLLWVTVLSLIIAFVIARLIAKRFSKPIGQLSEQAKMLSEEVYEDRFQKGFCRELDELNDSLQQSAEKLSEARTYQKELLANVSHDLRTPLTMIKGYAEMVRDISWDDEEQRNADTGVIIKEADRLTALVNEILEYSSLQEGGTETVFTSVDLSELTEKVLDRFEPLFQQQGGIIERVITPGCIVRGSAELLERAVYNLVDNALRHTTDEDKRITVTVRKDHGVCLEVRDYGEGIDQAELPRIWDKYYTSRQRGNQGVSGLGLAIVKQIALIHDAETEAESEPGKGSVFRLRMKA